MFFSALQLISIFVFYDDASWFSKNFETDLFAVFFYYLLSHLAIWLSSVEVDSNRIEYFFQLFNFFYYYFTAIIVNFMHLSGHSAILLIWFIYICCYMDEKQFKIYQMTNDQWSPQWSMITIIEWVEWILDCGWRKYLIYGCHQSTSRIWLFNARNKSMIIIHGHWLSLNSCDWVFYLSLSFETGTEPPNFHMFPIK